MAEVTETKQAETRETTDTVKNEEELGQAQTPNLPEEEKYEALKAASEGKEDEKKEPAKPAELSEAEFNKRYYSGYFNAAVNAFKENGNLDKLNADISAGSVDPVDKYDENLGIEVTNEKDLQRLVNLVPKIAKNLLRQKLLERYQEKIKAGQDPTVWAKGEMVNLKNEVYDNAVNFIKVNSNDCLTSEDLQSFLQEKEVGLTHDDYVKKLGEIYKGKETVVKNQKFNEDSNIKRVNKNGQWVKTLTPEARQAVQAEAIGYLQNSFPPFPSLLKNEFSN